MVFCYSIPIKLRHIYFVKIIPKYLLLILLQMELSFKLNFYCSLLEYGNAIDLILYLVTLLNLLISSSSFS